MKKAPASITFAPTSGTEREFVSAQLFSTGPLTWRNKWAAICFVSQLPRRASSVMSEFGFDIHLESGENPTNSKAMSRHKLNGVKAGVKAAVNQSSQCCCKVFCLTVTAPSTAPFAYWKKNCWLGGCTVSYRWTTLKKEVRTKAVSYRPKIMHIFVYWPTLRQ